MGERLTVGVAARLSRYLQVLTQAKKMGKERISSQEISEYTNINATQIRRDLSGFGKFGKRGVGYSIDVLLAEIRKILRTQGQHNIALFGAGPARPGDRELDGLRRPRLQHRRRLRHRPGQGRRADRQDRWSRLRAASRDIRSARRTSSSAFWRSRPRPRRASRTISSTPASRSSSTTPRRSSHVPPDVTVHTTSPAVELLYALYFYLT